MTLTQMRSHGRKRLTPLFKCRWYGVARVSTSCEVDLSVGVQVETSLAVQKVRDKCSMLPSMDKKLDTILGLYTFAVVISVVLTWLVQFNVVNTSNQFVYMVGDFLYRITEPLLKRIRSVVPAIGGMDLSPLILLLALFFVRSLIRNNLILG